MVNIRVALSLVLAMATLLSGAPFGPQANATSPGTPATYTLNADFDQGTLVGINHTAVPDQLQLNGSGGAFNFIWIAASARGTIIKINTDTGAILGEYRSAPDGMARNPSRTTVDANGNVWASNRNEAGVVAAGAIAPGVPAAGGGMGSVLRIGLKENNQCQDRNGNGVIDTSTGLSDIKAWTNAGGVNSLGGVSTAADECIINYTRVNGTNTRHVSVDKFNNVWVGGLGDRQFDKLDGVTGQIVRQENSVGYGGYGGLIDGNMVVWSAQPLLMWPTANPLTGANGDPVPGGNNNIGPLLAGTNWAGQGGDSYGLCIDPTGNVWNTQLSGNLIRKYSPAGVHLGAFAHGDDNAQGCAVDKNGDVWVAHSLFSATTVGHLKNDGTFVGNVALPTGNGPTGVSVDAKGKVWSANINSNNASRIDPALNGGIGGVDLEVSLGAGAGPYNYSDMTGSSTLAAPGNGSWTVVHDTTIPGVEWGRVSWNGTTPGDSTLTVTAASSADGIIFGPPETATNGGDLSVANGRYLKVIVSFKRASTGESPILFDLTISANRPPDCSAAAANPGIIWPPNHKLVPVSVVGVTDPDGDAVTITITSIRQDEPVNGVADGDTSPDGTGVGSSTAQVRAERAGSPKVPGNGRVYHIGFKAIDGKGGACSGIVKVGVPHDQGQGDVPVDGGPLYDSTLP